MSIPDAPWVGKCKEDYYGYDDEEAEYYDDEEEEDDEDDEDRA